MPGQPIANTEEFPVGPQAATTLGRLTEPLQRTSRIFAASIWGEAAFSLAELSGGAPTTDTATRPGQHAHDDLSRPDGDGGAGRHRAPAAPSVSVAGAGRFQTVSS